MRFSILLLTFFFFLALQPNQIMGQADIPFTFPVDFITQFQDIYVADDGEGYAAGECGVVRRTVDEGQTWNAVNSPTDHDIETVACAPNDCSKALLAATNGLFRLENNVWTDVTYPDYQFGNQLHWITDELVIFETQGMEYQRSTDGGLTWAPVPLSTWQQANIFVLDANNGYLFVDDTLFNVTANWASVEKVGYIHAGDVRAMTWLDENNGWLFDQDRFFYNTTDGGQSWTLLNAESQLTSVNWMVPLSEMHIVGAQVTTQKIESLDGGVTWTREDFLPGVGAERINEKYHRLDDAFFTVGNQSQLLYSEIGFTNFTELDPFDRQGRIESIAFVSEEEGYAATRSDVLRTSNAGQTWEKTPIPGNYRDMAVLDNGAVVILGSGDSYISMDNGITFETWIPESVIPDNEQPSEFGRKPNGDLYLMSSNYGYMSTDGVTFIALQVDHGFDPTGIHFLDNENGFAVGRSNNFMKTTDGGMTWTLGMWPANNSVDIYFTDEMNGWISEARNRYVTKDGGDTWSTDSATGGYDITRLSDGTLYAPRFGSGNTGELGRSVDGGENWDIVATNCYSYRSGAATPSGKFFFTGGDGWIVRHDLVALTTNTGPNIQRDVLALNAYPNPTAADFQVDLPAGNQSANIEIYNTNGTLMYRQTNVEGISKLDLTLENYSEGMYIVKWTNGEKNGLARVLKIAE